ncbi:Cytochrome c heme lyase subunit CcmL [hydrothermal vent metagenome]|uniref:Cytochrome c heme lyase subunit CcmL n=1 Tax=hydrothermal vent metagenome TaxID=652676 RepID=A0A3B0SAI1_9ZZZZ
MIRLPVALLLIVLFAIAWPAFAVTPEEQLADPVLEQRAREVSKQLRCVVCQNQSIDGSNAPLAADMRRLVRQRLQAGDSNQQVIDYIVDRYGNFVLLRPPLNQNTLALWLGPLGFVVFGILIFWRTSRQKQKTETQPTDEDQRVQQILNQFREDN